MRKETGLYFLLGKEESTKEEPGGRDEKAS